MFFEPKAIITGIKLLDSDFRKIKSTKVPGRPFHAISYRFAGTATFFWQEQRLFSPPGSITFLPQNCSYRTSVPEPGRFVVIHFTTLQEYHNLSPFVLAPKQAKPFECLFKELSEMYQSGRETDYQCFSVVYHILSDLDRVFISERQACMPERIQRARQYIDSNYRLPISVPELALDASVSETYFRKEFKKYLGLNPATYIQKIRIENAKALLLTGYYQVGEVAIRCGFDSISYFSYVFHRQTGMTPTEYIVSQRKKVDC